MPQSTIIFLSLNLQDQINYVSYKLTFLAILTKENHYNLLTSKYQSTHSNEANYKCLSSCSISASKQICFQFRVDKRFNNDAKLNYAETGGAK